MSTPPPPVYQIHLLFMGAGGIGDSNSTNWKVMLAGNKLENHTELSAMGMMKLRFMRTMIALPRNMESITGGCCIGAPYAGERIPTGLSTNVPAGPGCQATESIFYGNDEGGTTLDLIQEDLLYEAGVEKLAIHGMS